MSIADGYIGTLLQSCNDETAANFGKMRLRLYKRCAALVLCNRYGLPIAARSLGEFQEASEAPVSIAILAERATRKFTQRTAARRVELKMSRRLRCVSVTRRKGHAPSSRLGGGPF